MTRGFDLNSLKKETVPDNRYERRIAALTAQGQDTERIKSVVDSAIENIGNKINSFVIYGEPQSGKTEMMIALTAKLLDAWPLI
jgi:DNA replication protein DnaC